jgi:hypothetical protein
LDLLKSKDCANAVGAQSSQQAESKLENNIPQLKLLGQLQFTGTSSDLQLVPNSPPLAQSNTGFLGLGQSISINDSFSYWTAPQIAWVSVNGVGQTINEVAAEAYQDGVSTLTGDQYRSLIILHELKHLFGGDHPGDTPAALKAYDMPILQNCFGLTVH